MKTLLEQAKEIKSKRRIKRQFIDDDFELAVAYMRSEISATQYTKVLGRETTSGNYLYHVASALKEGVRRGVVKISYKREAK